MFDHIISQKVRSFRTFSKLLEALQYETLFERLVDYTVINDIKAITFYNKH